MESKSNSISQTVQKLMEIAKPMPQGRPAIVIPTIRDGQVFSKFYSKWEQHFAGCNVIIVEDRRENIVFSGIQTSTEVWKTKPDNVWIFNWNDIDEVMGENAWIIPRGSDCVRSFGYLVAQACNPLFILTLDDDVFPIDNPVVKHYKVLTNYIEQSHKAFNTLKNKKPRGLLSSDVTYPDVSHGAWYKIPDYDAETHANNFGEEIDGNDFYEGLVPYGAYAPICGMNLAWNPIVTRYMYFTLQGKDLNGEPYGIDRCGDIWAGYVCQAAGVPVATGYAPVIHDKLSNVWVNMTKEKLARNYTQDFFSLIAEKNFGDTAKYFDKEEGEYFVKLFKAYQVWFDIVDSIKFDTDRVYVKFDFVDPKAVLEHLEENREEWEKPFAERLWANIRYTENEQENEDDSTN